MLGELFICWICCWPGDWLWWCCCWLTTAWITGELAATQLGIAIEIDGAGDEAVVVAWKLRCMLITICLGEKLVAQLMSACCGILTASWQSARCCFSRSATFLLVSTSRGSLKYLNKSLRSVWPYIRNVMSGILSARSAPLVSMLKLSWNWLSRKSTWPLNKNDWALMLESSSEFANRMVSRRASCACW